jgi:hypothetical protein
MIYQVQSIDLRGGRVTWEYDNEHEAKCQVRKLKDEFGDMFIIKLVKIAKQPVV